MNGLALTVEQQAILMLLDRVEALEREVRELRRDVDAERHQFAKLDPNDGHA